MANFRAYPGKYVEVIKEVKSYMPPFTTIKPREKLQILSGPGLWTNHFIFVGINGAFLIKDLHSAGIKPIEDGE